MLDKAPRRFYIRPLVKRRKSEKATCDTYWAQVKASLRSEMIDVYAEAWEVDQRVRNLHRVPKRERPFCTAICVSTGESCGARAVPGHRRCRLHGGAELAAWRARRRATIKRHRAIAKAWRVKRPTS